MLAWRPHCECFDPDLPASSALARIGSFECPFCVDYADTRLQGRCPNRGGELVNRPRRPDAKLGQYPGSTKRVLKPAGCTPSRA